MKVVIVNYCSIGSTEEQKKTKSRLKIANLNQGQFLYYSSNDDDVGSMIPIECDNPIIFRSRVCIIKLKGKRNQNA